MGQSSFLKLCCGLSVIPVVVLNVTDSWQTDVVTRRLWFDLNRMSQSSQVEPLHVDFGRFLHTDDVGLQSLASAVWCVLIATRRLTLPSLLFVSPIPLQPLRSTSTFSLSFFFVVVTNRPSDDHGEIYIISSRCPYFGCQLLQWSWGIRPNEISGVCVCFENGKN